MGTLPKAGLPYLEYTCNPVNAPLSITKLKNQKRMYTAVLEKMQNFITVAMPTKQ